jgi:hypothetical protein
MAPPCSLIGGSKLRPIPTAEKTDKLETTVFTRNDRGGRDATVDTRTESMSHGIVPDGNSSMNAGQVEDSSVNLLDL